MDLENIVLISSDGTKWTIVVDNSGQLSAIKRI